MDIRAHLRPGLAEFLTEVHQFCDLYLYTHGTLAYATSVVAGIDPRGVLFGQPPRLFARDNTPSGVKRLSQILRSDTTLALVVDDRDEVWSHEVRKEHLLKISPYLRFDDDGRTAASLEGFIARWQPEEEICAQKTKANHCHASKRQRLDVGESCAVHDSGLGVALHGPRSTPKRRGRDSLSFAPTPDADAGLGLRYGIRGTSCASAHLAARSRGKIVVSTTCTTMTVENAASDGTASPQRSSEAASEMPKSSRHSLGCGDATKQKGNSTQESAPEARDDDRQLHVVAQNLRLIHSEIFKSFDAPGSVTAKQASVGDVLPKLRGQTLAGCFVCLTGLTSSDMELGSHPLVCWCTMLGATVEAEVTSSTSHVVAARRGTRKWCRALRLAEQGEDIHVVHPGWVLAAVATWRRPSERLFAAPLEGSWPSFVDIWTPLAGTF